jgi:hypothetical protein
MHPSQQNMTIPAIGIQVCSGAITFGLEQEEIISSAALVDAQHERLADNAVVLGFASSTPTHMKDICLGPVRFPRTSAVHQGAGRAHQA